MEQMHPGEQHEQMDEMMGGDGSETLKGMHINMAKSFYCGEHEAMSSGMMSSGMMNMMMGQGMCMKHGAMSSGMMDQGMMDQGMGMMGSSNFQSKGGMMNMMGSYPTAGSFFSMSLIWIVFIAIGAFVFGVVFWWTYKLIVNSKKRIHEP